MREFCCTWADLHHKLKTLSISCINKLIRIASVMLTHLLDSIILHAFSACPCSCSRSDSFSCNIILHNKYSAICITSTLTSLHVDILISAHLSNSACTKELKAQVNKMLTDKSWVDWLGTDNFSPCVTHLLITHHHLSQWQEQHAHTYVQKYYIIGFHIAISIITCAVTNLCIIIHTYLMFLLIYSNIFSPFCPNTPKLL